MWSVHWSSFQLPAVVGSCSPRSDGPVRRTARLWLLHVISRHLISWKKLTLLLPSNAELVADVIITNLSVTIMIRKLVTIVIVIAELVADVVLTNLNNRDYKVAVEQRSKYSSIRKKSVKCIIYRIHIRWIVKSL